MLVVALAVTAASAGLSACTSPKEGGRLPTVALTDLRTGDDAAWPRGKPLVVNLWATWCAPCRKEMPAFEEVHAKVGDAVTIVGVTDDPKLDAARKAADVAGVTYPLLVDVDTRLMVDLGVAGLPATVFVDADGTVLGRHLGALTEQELTKEIEERYGIQA